MKCQRCGQEHDELILTCHTRTCENRSRTRVYITRHAGEIIATCCHCDTVLATWPDASESGLDWTPEKPN